MDGSGIVHVNFFLSAKDKRIYRANRIGTEAQWKKITEGTPVINIIQRWGALENDRPFDLSDHIGMELTINPETNRMMPYNIQGLRNPSVNQLCSPYQ